VTKLGYSGNLRLTRSQDWYLVNLEIIILHQGWVKRDYVTYLSQLAEVCHTCPIWSSMMSIFVVSLTKKHSGSSLREGSSPSTARTPK